MEIITFQRVFNASKPRSNGRLSNNFTEVWVSKLFSTDSIDRPQSGSKAWRLREGRGNCERDRENKRGIKKKTKWETNKKREKISEPKEFVVILVFFFYSLAMAEFIKPTDANFVYVKASKDFL